MEHIRTDRFEAAAITEIGKIRKRNEDTYRIDAELGLFIVSDGLGGHNSGHIASRMVTELLPDILRAGLLETVHTQDGATDAFRNAIIALNNQVFNKASSASYMNGMGATIVSSLIRDDHTYIASVGDSPAYIYTEGRLLKLTIEHTVGTLLKNNQNLKHSVPLPALLKNLLVQYIGMEIEPAPDIIRIDFKPGERLLLCSDGLTSCLREDTIGDFLPHGSPAESCRRLTDLAMSAGGVDNITVVVIDRLPRS